MTPEMRRAAANIALTLAILEDEDSKLTGVDKFDLYDTLRDQLRWLDHATDDAHWDLNEEIEDLAEAVPPA